MQEATAKLFHCAVVMGAAIGTGCGSTGLVTIDGGGDASGSEHRAGAAAVRERLRRGRGHRRRGGAGDAACRASSPTAQDARTQERAAGPPTQPTAPAMARTRRIPLCGLASSPTGCQCVAGSPLSAADCPAPAQFTCAGDGPCRAGAGAWRMPQPRRRSAVPAPRMPPRTRATRRRRRVGTARPPSLATLSIPPTGCACVMLPPPIL